MKGNFWRSQGKRPTFCIVAHDGINALSFWWKHAIILINVCEKTLIAIGVTMEYGHPLTTWVMEHVELPIGKMNTPSREEFPLA